MKHTKFLAMFAVLVMVLGSLTCIVATSENNSGSDADATYSVTLDASKDFRANKSELNKLGITDQSAWKYDRTGTTLVLDSIDYSTKNCVAVTVIGDCNNFTIVLKGENTIACGTNKTASTDYIDALWIRSAVKKTTITGDGQLTLKCNGVTDSYGGSGLYANNDVIVSGCKLIAFGPTINQTASDKPADYSSNGIYIANGRLQVTDGATVFAQGGDVSTKSICYYDGEQHSTKSTGIHLNAKVSTPTLIVKDSAVVGLGGDVESETRGVEAPSVDLDARSLGIYAKSDISLDNAILRGYGGTVIGHDPTTGKGARQNVLSAGMRFNEDIEAINSEITMYGGKTVSNEIAISAGMRHFVDLDAGEQAKKLTISLTYCDLYTYGGASTSDVKTIRGSVGGSFGFYASEIGVNGDGFDIAITLDDSIAHFGGNRNYNGISYGICIYGHKTDGEKITSTAIKGTITVEGSELYVNGYTKAVIANKVVSKGYEYCYVGTEPYTREYRATPVNFTDDEVLYCVVGFQYNLFTLIGKSIYSPIMSYAYDQSKVKLPNYEMGYVPDGQKFKCWSIDGKEYKPGEIVDLSDGPLTAFAVFEEDTGSNNGNTLIWAIVLIVAIIVILLIIVLLTMHKPSATKKSEAKQVKKSAKPKKVAKPKTTAKKAPAKKTPAKRTTTKKTASKPKAKRTSKK